jgi:hypothetical protein
LSSGASSAEAWKAPFPVIRIDHPWPVKMAKSSACSLKLNLQRSEAIFAMRTWAFLWRFIAMIVASARLRNRERLTAT